MTAVVDSSPLIVLGKVRRLDLLPALYSQVRAAQDIRLVQTLSVDLGRGEAEAIALAAEISDALLIMDDSDGRRVARALGFRVTGVLGVLVEAKYRGAVPAVRPILEALSNEGFWVSESLQRAVLDGVGE